MLGIGILSSYLLRNYEFFKNPWTKIGILAKGLEDFPLLIFFFPTRKCEFDGNRIGAVKPVIQARTIFCSLIRLL